MTPDSVLTNYAPTEYTTASSLNQAGSGLERLLNLAVGGYTSVLQAKNQATAAKLALADANKSGVTPPPAAAESGFALSPKVIVYGALGLGALILGVSLLRSNKP